MSNIKDQGEIIIVQEVDLRIFSIVNKMFEGKGAFIIQVEKFNIPSQKYLGLQHASHLKGLKLGDNRAKDIKVLIEAGIPEGEPIAIKIPLKENP